MLMVMMCVGADADGVCVGADADGVCVGADGDIITETIDVTLPMTAGGFAMCAYGVVCLWCWC